MAASVFSSRGGAKIERLGSRTHVQVGSAEGEMNVTVAPAPLLLIDGQNGIRARASYGHRLREESSPNMEETKFGGAFPENTCIVICRLHVSVEKGPC